MTKGIDAMCFLLRESFKLLPVSIVLCVAIATSECTADEKEQVEALEKGVAQFELLIQTADNFAALLGQVQDGPSAESALRQFEQSARDFRSQLEKMASLTKEVREQFVNVRPPRNEEYRARAQAAVEQSQSMQKVWAKSIATLMEQTKRVYQLEGLPDQFCDAYEVEVHRLVLAELDFGNAVGQAVDAELVTQVRDRLSLFDSYGPRKVVRIMLGNAGAAESQNAAASLRRTLGGKTVTIVTGDLVTNESAILVAPVDRLEDVKQAVDFGKVTETDEPRRVIVVRPQSAATTPEEIEAALQILTDNGKFPLDSPSPEPRLTPMTIPGNFGVPRMSQPQNPNRGTDLMRRALRELGTEGILTVDLQTDNFQQLKDFEAFAYWHDRETGWAFFMVNGRYFLIYRGSVEDFAKHVDIETVTATDNAKRRVVIIADPEKISPQEQLKYFSGRKDDEIEQTRQRLERRIVLHQLEEIAQKQGTKLELHGKDAASTMEELTSSNKNREEANRNAMRDSVHQSIEQSHREIIDTLKGMRLTDDNAPKDMSTEDWDAFNRNINNQIRNHTMGMRIGKSPAELNRKSTAVPIYDLGTLTKPFQSIPADEQATDGEEGRVNVVPFFVAHAEPAEFE